MLDQLSAAAPTIAALVIAVLGAILVLEPRSRLRRFEGAVYELRAPLRNLEPERFFESLHGLLRTPLAQLAGGQPHVELALVGSGDAIGVRLWIPSGEEDLVRAALEAAYPGCELLPANGESARARKELSARARLLRTELLPLRTKFDGESLGGVIAALARTGDGEEVKLELALRPASGAWRGAAARHAERLRAGPRSAGLFGLTRVGFVYDVERRQAAAIETKARSRGYRCSLRLVATSATRARSRELIRAVAAGLGSFADENELRFARPTIVPRTVRSTNQRRFPLRGSFLLTAPELVALWHVPVTVPSRLPVSGTPATQGERQLGFTTLGGRRRPVRLAIADARQHLHLLGATGTGKSTAILNLALQDIAAGRGVAVLDPKGDLVRELLLRLPPGRRDDVIHIGPDEPERAVGINPLELAAGDDPELVAENALTIFKRIYERFWGMRTDDILKSSLLTLLRTPEPTLAHIPVLLTTPAFRRRITAGLGDPLGLDGFWRWYERLSEAQRTEAIGPALNKLRDFLIRPRLRHLLCQPRSTVDVRAVVDEGRILLADLSVGRWGETASALAGSFLVARLWQAVLARAARPEDERRDFFLYIDEFQNFLGIAGPFTDALAQARSLRLSLTIANQHLGQLPPEIREAVRANARSRLVFQCGQDDAASLGREFAPLDATALLSLDRFEAAARLCLDGQTRPAFTLRTLPPAAGIDAAGASEIRAASRRRYGSERASIDRQLARALGLTIPNEDEPFGETPGGEIK